MVITVSRRNATKIPAQSFGTNVLMWAAVVVAPLALGACSGSGKEAPKTTADKPQAAKVEQPPALVFGGAGPSGTGPAGAGGARFVQPAAGAKGAPDLNTVPTATPSPRSSKEARDKVIAGLVADRTNARYSDQTGRTQPVAVRPLVDTPEAARTDIVAKIDAPAPPRPAEAPALAAPAAAAVDSDVGPRAPGNAPRRSGGGEVASAGGAPVANPGGFRSLGDFQVASYGRANLSGTLTMTGGNLTPNDRNVLNRTAREQIDSRGKIVVRVIGHGTGGIDRAVAAASELQRLGVAPANLFVGADMVTGPTEVFLNTGK